MPLRPPIYLDYHATTPVDPRVVDCVVNYMTTQFGNASSVDHEYGDAAAAAVTDAKREIAELLGSSPASVIFTSGATESINLALQGLATSRRTPSSALRIGLSPLEHRAVIDTCEVLERRGAARLTWFLVDTAGRLDLQQLEDRCRDGLDLVCVMAANNEIGTIYPLLEISRICARWGVRLFTDATQAAGKVPLEFDEWGIALMAVTAHKMYGPKGVGALLVAPGIDVDPLIHGGGHQRGLRSGTLNVPGIAGFGLACQLRRKEMAEDEPLIARMRDRLQACIVEAIPDARVNGDTSNRLAGNLHISIPGVPNTAVMARLRHLLAISTGSACSSGTVAQSHVMRALGLSDDLVEGSLRFGLGKFTTDEEVGSAALHVTTAVEKVRHALGA
jgi:cysteine desulfurase